MNMLRATTSISALAIAGMITGCANPGVRMGQAPSVTGSEIGLATRAHLTLASGDALGAIPLAERAVEKSPTDVTVRTILANAYLAAGRFASAEAAYGDVLALQPSDAGIALKLVLAQIAQGRNEAALVLLDQLRGSAEAADVGLAMALAGQPGNAVAVLDEAARRPGADSRTRQNLALAHALAGDWDMARVVAGQDVPADQLDARLAGWMEMAKGGPAATKIASLIGVTPALNDPGQPVRLALNSSATPQLAVAEPVPSMPVQEVAMAAPVEPQPVEQTVMNDPAFAASAPAPAVTATVALPAPQAPLADVSQTLEALRTEPVRASGKLPKVSELRRSAAARFGKSKVVVQLGAYNSPQALQAGWAKIAKRHSAVGRYTPATARFQASIGNVYRLSLKGFASDGEARRMCGKLKASGAACFVRNMAGDTAIKLAAR